MEQPIIDPPTPYLGPINGGFVPAKLVRIQGYASPIGERIDINFQTSQSTAPRDDIGLHMSVRLAEGYVARNSLQGGMWGDEQGDGDLPIQPGQKFEIIVLADRTQFKIAINGKHFCEFPQRFQSALINHLSIEGDVSLSLIAYEYVPLGDGPGPQAAPQPIQHGPPSTGPGGFGPPPNMGQQGQYGPPPGDFGPPGYAPPPPPGHEPESGLESFIDSASGIIAGAISSGVASQLLGSITGGGANQQQQQNPTQPPPQQQPNYNTPQGGSQDTLGGLGSILSSLTGQNNQAQSQPYGQSQPYRQQQQPQQGGGDALAGLGSLLSSFTSGQQQQQAQPQPPPQQQPQQGGADALAGLGSLLSSFTSQQHQQQQPQQQPGFSPSQIGGQGSVGGLGSVGSLLSTLAGQVITPQNRDERH